MTTPAPQKIEPTLSEERDRLLALDAACPKIDFSSAERVDDESLECPLCDGDRYVTGKYYENLSGLPLSIFVVAGIGNEFLAAEKMIEAMPDAMALIRRYSAELAAAQARIANLEAAHIGTHMVDDSCYDWGRNHYHCALRKLDAIKAAAQAVIDRWETPHWKDAGPTGSVIYALRDAIKSAGSVG